MTVYIYDLDQTVSTRDCYVDDFTLVFEVPIPVSCGDHHLNGFVNITLFSAYSIARFPNVTP